MSSRHDLCTIQSRMSLSIQCICHLFIQRQNCRLRSRFCLCLGTIFQWRRCIADKWFLLNNFVSLWAFDMISFTTFLDCYYLSNPCLRQAFIVLGSLFHLTLKTWMSVDPTTNYLVNNSLSIPNFFTIYVAIPTKSTMLNRLVSWNMVVVPVIFSIVGKTTWVVIKKILPGEMT